MAEERSTRRSSPSILKCLFRRILLSATGFARMRTLKARTTNAHHTEPGQIILAVLDLSRFSRHVSRAASPNTPLPAFRPVTYPPLSRRPVDKLRLATGLIRTREILLLS